MKKILILVIALLLTCSVACAEFDLSSMSYDDLVALSQSVTAEIMGRPEWKEVKVSSGVYEIGKDIPEGSYSIECDNPRHAIIEVRKPGKSNFVFYKLISSGEIIGKVILEAGNTIEISNDVIFKPPVSLGF